MGFIKFFDMPAKEPGEGLNTADRLILSSSLWSWALSQPL